MTSVNTIHQSFQNYEPRLPGGRKSIILGVLEYLNKTLTILIL